MKGNKKRMLGPEDFPREVTPCREIDMWDIEREFEDFIVSLREGILQAIKENLKDNADYPLAVSLLSQWDAKKSELVMRLFPALARDKYMNEIITDAINSDASFSVPGVGQTIGELFYFFMLALRVKEGELDILNNFFDNLKKEEGE